MLQMLDFKCDVDDSFASGILVAPGLWTDPVLEVSFGHDIYHRSRPSKRIGKMAWRLRERRDEL
jgi:hypothetical protein